MIRTIIGKYGYIQFCTLCFALDFVVGIMSNGYLEAIVWWLHYLFTYFTICLLLGLYIVSNFSCLIYAVMNILYKSKLLVPGYLFYFWPLLNHLICSNHFSVDSLLSIQPHHLQIMTVLFLFYNNTSYFHFMSYYIG